MVTETATWLEYSMKNFDENTMWNQDFLQIAPPSHAMQQSAQFQSQPMQQLHPQQIHQTVPIQNVPITQNHRGDPKKEDRSNRREMATQREKRRMEKLNTCIEDIRSIVCPEMKTPTKAKILREAINRILYLEKVTSEMLAAKGNLPQLNQNQPFDSLVSHTQRSASPDDLSPDSSYADNQNFSPETSLAFAQSPDSEQGQIVNDTALPAVTVTQDAYYVYETGNQEDQTIPHTAAGAGYNHFMQDEIVCYQYE